MTEQDNTQRTEALFAAFGRGDVPFILDQLTDDVRWVAHLDPVVPWAGDHSGRAAVPGFFHALGGAVEVSAHPVHEIVAQGDTVVAMGDVTFRARATGRESTSSWVYVWRFREGKVCGYDQFNDPGLAAAFR
jgi:ketosteroid isomerase-like protein